MKDRVYAEKQTQLVDFAFDAGVASVFPDMIRRSVPGYELVVPMTGLMASRYLKEGGHAYDLGCSLGATTLAILSQLGDVDARITAVDNAPAMLERAAAQLTDPRVTLMEADVRDMAFAPAEVVISNWLLQFVPEPQRLDVLRNVNGALPDDGVLLLSEKIRYEDEAVQGMFEDAHHDFKRANGYSDLEVSQKRNALENVMVPDTEEVHRTRLAAAGFTRVTVWFRCLNWISFIAQP